MIKSFARYVLFGACVLFLYACQATVKEGGQRPLDRGNDVDVKPDSEPSLGGTEIGNPEVLIRADQVAFDDQQGTLTAATVQEALQLLALRLEDVIVGEWSIENKNEEDLHADSGAIIIAADGTFNLYSGSFAAIGMGSNPSFCNHKEEGQVYEFLGKNAVLFTHINPASSGDATNAVVPYLAHLEENEMVFIGVGGCGWLGHQRASILTRIK